MILDRAYQDAYQLSYNQFKAVQSLRKARQAIKQRDGLNPSDEEVAQKLKIKEKRLQQIKQWEQKLTTLRYDEDWDGGSSDEGDFSSY
jgi:DNA-directed RNA polymerase specialized sigma subunit